MCVCVCLHNGILVLFRRSNSARCYSTCYAVTSIFTAMNQSYYRSLFLLIFIIIVTTINCDFTNTASYVNERLKLAATDLFEIEGNLTSNNLQTIHLNNYNPSQFLIAETTNTSTTGTFRVIIYVIDRDTLELIETLNESIQFNNVDKDTNGKCIVSAYENGNIIIDYFKAFYLE